MTFCLLNEDAGYLYVNNPKSACSSIKWAIAKHLGVRYAPRGKTPFTSHVRSWRTAMRRHDLFRFTVIRNPFARLVSVWADFLQPPWTDDALELNPGLQRWKEWSFEDVVRDLVQIPDRFLNAHVAPQIYQVRHGRHWLVDKYWRLDDIQEAWAELQERFGLPDLERHRASEHRPWPEYYTPELKRMVARRFAHDFQLGGWETT